MIGEMTEKTKPEKKKKTREEIEEARKHGVLINDDGEYCRQVPECGCGCWDPWGGYVP